MTLQYSIAKLFKDKTSLTPSKNSLGWIENNQLQFYTNDEYFKMVASLSQGLVQLGFEVQKPLAILSQTNKEWHLVDLATLSARGVVIPVYPTYTAQEVLYILNHSEATFLYLEDEDQFEKFIEVQNEAKFIKAIISQKEISSELQSKLDSKFIFKTYSQLLQLGSDTFGRNPAAYYDLVEQSNGDDLASIIYTSGTTGEPKGAVVTNKAFTSMLYNVKTTLNVNVTSQDRTLTFLPLSHVFGRCDSMLNLIFDFECVFAESIDKVVENLAIAKPTVLLAVPRIFEKVYAKVLENIANESPLKQKVFQWALGASTQYYEKINNDIAPTSFEVIQKNLAYKLVFSKIYDRFGGRIRFLISGGAPLAPEIILFLQNANLTILEGYGLTETIAPCILNPVVKQIPGTIGLPLGDVQVKFADDGEIMLKTQALFTEYYKNSKATEEAFKDGWFLTGDIGELTTEGYIKITDRKKDIIITAAGKNVAPQKLENSLKLKKHIANAMVVGDKRKFLVAIISIDPDSFKDDLATLGLPANATYEEIASNKQVTEIIQNEVDETNQTLARFETIKGFLIAPQDFTVENGQITPSLKLKKKVILKTYADEIDALYAELETSRH